MHEKKKPEESGREGSGLRAPHSRRVFLRGMGVAAGATAILPSVGLGQEGGAAGTSGLTELGRDARQITLQIDGETKRVEVEPRTTLLEALRSHLGITGPKEVCDRGSCGACTVMVDGVTVTACMMLAMDAVGRDVVTIHGLAKDPKYRHLFEALCDHDGAQCGYCIPGFVMRSAELLDHIPNPTPDQVRQALAGNICRCGTYTKLFESIAAAAGKGGM